MIGVLSLPLFHCKRIRVNFIHNTQNWHTRALPWGQDISVRTQQKFQARLLGNFQDWVSSVAWAWGHKFSSEAMHDYMVENRFFFWSYHAGIAFKSIQQSFDICRVFNHHSVHHIHQRITQEWSVDYTIYTNFNEPSHLAYPTSNIGLRSSRHAFRLVVANVTFQYPAAPFRIIQFLSMCNDNVPLFVGRLPIDVFSILEAAGHNVIIGLWG